MKEIRHRASANPQLHKMAKKEAEHLCYAHGHDSGRIDHITACALHRALNTAPTSTARHKMAACFPMLKETEDVS